MRHLLPILPFIFAACLDPAADGNLVPKTVDEDPTLPAIEVNGTRLHAETFGDPRAPMIVMLHGGPGGDYRDMLPYKALADDGYYVVFWDNRGGGLSRRHDASSYSLDTYLEDLRLVIEHYTTSSDQKVVFIGHSWGAMYATWFLNEHGDYGGRVVGAVLSDPGAFDKKGLEDYIKRQFPPWGMTSEELNDVAWADQVMSADDHARADYMIALPVIAGFPKEHNDPNNPAPFWRKGAVVLNRLTKMGIDSNFDWTAHLGEYRHKVLFLRGDLNENQTLADQQALAAHFAMSEVVTVPGAGHEAMWEKPPEFLAHIRAYFAEIGFEAEGGAK